MTNNKWIGHNVCSLHVKPEIDVVWAAEQRDFD
jgi:hypothetical protein